MSIYLSLLVVIIPPTFATIVTDPWLIPQPCGAGVGGYLPQNVKITACNTDPCTFIVGETVNLYIDFKIHAEIESLRLEVNLIDEIDEIYLNYPFAEANRHIRGRMGSSSWPLKKGEDVLLKMELPIVRLRDHTNVARILQVGLRDQNKTMTMCFQFGVIFDKHPTYYINYS